MGSQSLVLLFSLLLSTLIQRTTTNIIQLRTAQINTNKTNGFDFVSHHRRGGSLTEKRTWLISFSVLGPNPDRLREFEELCDCPIRLYVPNQAFIFTSGVEGASKLREQKGFEWIAELSPSHRHGFSLSLLPVSFSPFLALSSADDCSVW